MTDKDQMAEHIVNNERRLGRYMLFAAGALDVPLEEVDELVTEEYGRALAGLLVRKSAERDGLAQRLDMLAQAIAASRNTAHRERAHDDYTAGLYSGLEVAASIVENRACEPFAPPGRSRVAGVLEAQAIPTGELTPEQELALELNEAQLQVDGMTAHINELTMARETLGLRLTRLLDIWHSWVTHGDGAAYCPVCCGDLDEACPTADRLFGYVQLHMQELREHLVERELLMK